MSTWDLQGLVLDVLCDGPLGELVVLRGDGTYRLTRTPEAMLQSEVGTVRAFGQLLLDQRRVVKQEEGKR
jgi:hypothetical protein